MKAIIYTQYGPLEGLRIRDIDRPEPKADEVLIKVKATTAPTIRGRVLSDGRSPTTSSTTP